MNDTELKLASPWQTFANEVCALFDEDEEVDVEFNNELKKISIYVRNQAKADALTELIPVVKDFGNVVISIVVIPENSNGDQTVVDLPMMVAEGSNLKQVKLVYSESNDDGTEKDTSIYGKLIDAFNGNPAVNRIVPVQSVFGSFVYVAFAKKVVQFFNDQLDDLHGLKSMLYQEIAKDVFGDVVGVFFCTDLENVGNSHLWWGERIQK